MRFFDQKTRQLPSTERIMDDFLANLNMFRADFKGVIHKQIPENEEGFGRFVDADDRKGYVSEEDLREFYGDLKFVILNEGTPKFEIPVRKELLHFNKEEGRKKIENFWQIFDDLRTKILATGETGYSCVIQTHLGNFQLFC